MGKRYNPDWAVEITPARNVNRYSDYDRDDEIVEDKVAIRLTFKGKPKMTLGVIDLRDDNFDDKLAAARLKAEERAGSLLAQGAVA